jgi:hypothetical protein
MMLTRLENMVQLQVVSTEQLAASIHLQVAATEKLAATINENQEAHPDTIETQGE